MNQDRLKKMNSLLWEIVSNSIYENTLEIQNNFWLITVNSVNLASDMWYLDVYVSSIKSWELLCKTLAKYAQKVKEDINSKIILRKTPIIRFRYNDEIEFSSDLISKIEALDIKNI